MSVPASDIFAQNLYEIPECSICLIQLTKDLAVLNCGHCFHLQCIMRHFQLRQFCPNCQQKCSKRQAMVLHYRPVLKKSSNQTSSGSTTNKSSQQTQLIHLSKLAKSQADELLKLKIQKNQLEIQLKVRQQFHDHNKYLLIRQRQQISQLTNRFTQVLRDKEQYQSLFKIECSQKSQLIQKIYQMQGKLRDYQILHKYQKVMNSSSTIQITKLKQQMEKDNFSPYKMAKQFYQVCMVCKLEDGKKNNKIRDLQQQFTLLEYKIEKAKEQNENLLKHMKVVLNKQEGEKKQNEMEKKQEISFEFTDTQEQKDKIEQSNYKLEVAQDLKTKKSKAQRKKGDRINTKSMK